MNAQKQTRRTSDRLLAKAQRFVAPLLVAGAIGIGGCRTDDSRMIITGLATACMEKKSCEMLVKKGDSLTKIHLNDDTKGYYEFRVADVDARGVTLELTMEIFMSEHAYGNFRLNYDGTKERWPKKVLQDQKIKAEKTFDATIAKIIVEREG